MVFRQAVRLALLGVVTTSLAVCSDPTPTQETQEESAPDAEVVPATGRWVSSRPLSSGADTGTLTFEISSVNESGGDNGRAFWNFMVERIVSATYDEAPRHLEFMVVSSLGGVTIVTGRISEDGRSMRARFSGPVRIGDAELQGPVGDTLTFHR